jgi:hypothetical protein
MSTTKGKDEKENILEKGRLEVDIGKSRVEKFFYDTHHKVKQMSDHYGVSTVINII